ncbi:hypothetical protein MSG28_002829 [Choristoneura fumiferana]|uniref:Uncharacterized protein n=1 Tax=Choristoneura fumiferana TaxID=7141 RepID=A0ACC0JK97_CHOFU|nr:hypothetical protein MSG28_002829 [Choristoneura fumiferana]
MPCSDHVMPPAEASNDVVTAKPPATPTAPAPVLSPTAKLHDKPGVRAAGAHSPRSGSVGRRARTSRTSA